MKTPHAFHRVLFALIGALLGAMVAFDLALLPQYLSDRWESPGVGELSMVILFFGTPILILLGILLGVFYSRKYK